MLILKAYSRGKYLTGCMQSFSLSKISVFLFCKYNKVEIFFYNFTKYLVSQKFYYLSYEY